MSSRHRNDVVTLFDVFCEVGASVENGDVVVLQKYPEDFNHEQTLKSITQFTFPCGLNDDEIDAVQLFSFVLTDEKSKYSFAFCRYTPRNNTCLCILSGLPWSNIFYKILNHISVVMNNRSSQEVELLLTCAYHTPIPSPGEVLVIESSSRETKLELVIPDLSKLPTLREDKYMLEFYNAVCEKQMIALYASLLKERRIVFTGRKLGQLSSCIFALETFLLPMQWQNLFIPVLPYGLIDMLMAPMPYLIGVPKKTLQAAKRLDLGDVVVVDLDEKTLQSSHDDVADLPSEAVSLLRHQLRSSSDMFLSDGLARSFLRTNVLLFGQYHMGFCRSLNSYTWDREQFIRRQKGSLQPFLKSLLGQDGVQYFERFVEERLEALNCGRPINDEFEREVCLLGQKLLKSSQLANPPEVLHQAVSTVRENATEVIGTLKGKVQSIAIKERLGRLTPKEMRRTSSKKLATNQFVETPMSFDTQQWNDTESPSPKPVPVPSTDKDTVVGDLIDFSDSRTECYTSQTFEVTRPVSPSTSGIPHKSLSPNLEPMVPPHHSFQSIDLNSVFPSSNDSLQQCNEQITLSRAKWERFD